jgi:hypothetical protein
MKNAKLLVSVFAILLFLVLACGGGKPVPTEYQGNWTGSDGSTIYMTSDGKAGFKMGSKSVDGGGAEIDESAKTLTISLFGISHTWKIDEKPNEDGEMTLDGVIYRRN